MTEINPDPTPAQPIQGPAQHADAARRHERSATDTDKFKEEMIRKRSQVGEADPDQKKKRKQQAEGEDDETPKEAPAPPPPSPFDLANQPDALKQGPGISPLSSAQPAQPSIRRSSNVTAAAPASEEMGPPPTAAPPPSLPVAQPTPPPPLQQPAPTPPPPTAQPTAPPPTTPSKSDQERPSDQKESQSSDTESEPPSILVPIEETLSILPPLSEELEMESLSQETGAPPPVAPALPQQLPAASTPEEAAEQPLQGPTSLSHEDREGSFSQHQKEKKEIGATAEKGASPPPPFVLTTSPSHGIPPSPSAYTTLSLPMLNLFERMVGAMSVMTDAKMTETTITLTSSQFSSSIFYGTQIVIREYTSAPKVFNIQLNSNPEAVAVFKGNADALMAAFQYGNYQFKVNRIDTNILSERPLFRRKEKISGDGQDQPDEGSK